MDNLMKQLINNVENMVYQYENGQSDYGVEEFPNKTADEWIEYCTSYDGIYNMKDNGHGGCMYAKGICDNLKFLGNDVIHNVILDTARDTGMLIE